MVYAPHAKGTRRAYWTTTDISSASTTLRHSCYDDGGTKWHGSVPLDRAESRCLDETGGGILKSSLP